MRVVAIGSILVRSDRDRHRAVIQLKLISCPRDAAATTTILQSRASDRGKMMSPGLGAARQSWMQRCDDPAPHNGSGHAGFVADRPGRDLGEAMLRDAVDPARSDASLAAIPARIREPT